MVKPTPSVLFDIKGDMCRLGYLKILVQIAKESQAYQIDYLSRFLIEKVTQKGLPKSEIERELKEADGLSFTGLVPKGRAVNYVEFSYKFDFFDERKKILGKFGKIYHKFLDVPKSKNNPRKDEISNSLILDVYDKIFFLFVLLKKDGDVLIPFIKYLQKKKDVSRQDGMNYFVEEILIKQCKDKLQSFSFNQRNKLRLNLLNWERYREQRSKRPKVWLKSEGYAFYRHNGNPRLEWLVDVGFLKKISSNFKTYEMSDKIIEAIEQVKTNEFSELIYYMGKIFLPEVTDADASQIKEQIISSYKKFSRHGYLSVDFEILVLLIMMDGLRNKILIKQTDIINSLKEIKNKNPKHVIFHLDSRGDPRFIKLNLKEILQ